VAGLLKMANQYNIGIGGIDSERGRVLFVYVCVALPRGT
jgi:hypothetical protein